MPRVIRPLVTVVTLSSFLCLAACGGSSDLSKSDYIAKVDPICAKYKGEADKIAAPNNGSDTKTVANYYDQLIIILDRQTNEIDDVGRPKEGKAQIDDLLKRQRMQIDRVRQLSTALRANDQAKANQIGADAAPVDKAIIADLKAFGFKTCGSSD